jgi:hypothetical protein
VKQLVDTGEENEDYKIINKGLSEGDILILNEPEKSDEIEIAGWEIYEEQLARQKELKLAGDTNLKSDADQTDLSVQKN